MDYKLVVTDVDDTLIDETLTISPANIAAVKAAMDRGVTVAVATGRMFDSALPYAQTLGIQAPMICCQGALICDVNTRELLYHLPVPLEYAKEILAFWREEGVYAQYYSTDHYYFVEECKESELYRRLSTTRGTALGESFYHPSYAPTKMLSISEPDHIKMLYDEAKSRWGDLLEIAISKPFYLEITHRDANKGKAVQQLAHSLGIPMEQVMCIGDALNDLSMINSAGMGVCMGNGHPLVKEQADYITLPQDQDGVAAAIRKFILKED